MGDNFWTGFMKEAQDYSAYAQGPWELLGEHSKNEKQKFMSLANREIDKITGGRDGKDV